MNNYGISGEAALKETYQRIIAYDKMRDMLGDLLNECRDSKDKQVKEIGNKIELIFENHRTEWN